MNLDLVIGFACFIAGVFLTAFVIAFYEYFSDLRPLPHKGKTYEPSLAKAFLDPKVQQAIDKAGAFGNPSMSPTDIAPKRRGRPRKVITVQKGTS